MSKGELLGRLYWLQGRLTAIRSRWSKEKRLLAAPIEYLRKTIESLEKRGKEDG